MPNKTILTDFCVTADGVCTVNPKPDLDAAPVMSQDAPKSGL